MNTAAELVSLNYRDIVVSQTPDNRWFTKDGRNKRISKDFKQFKPLIPPPVQTTNGQYRMNVIELIKNVREKWPHFSLTDALAIAIYLNGIFDNDKEFYSPARYIKGKQLLESI